MRINHKINTAEEISTFLLQHQKDISAYMLGEGSKLLGCLGECTAEDLYNLIANPDHATKEFVHIKLATDAGTEIPTAVEAILEQVEQIENFIYGFQVQGDILGSFRAGMIAGIIFHAQTAIGRKTPHGHLIVIPRVVTTDGEKIYTHQLDVKRLLKSIK